MLQSSELQDTSAILTLQRRYCDIHDEILTLKELIAAYELILYEQSRAFEEQLFGYMERYVQVPTDDSDHKDCGCDATMLYFVSASFSSGDSSEEPSLLQEQVELLETVLLDRQTLLKELYERRLGSTERDKKAFTSLL